MPIFRCVWQTTSRGRNETSIRKRIAPAVILAGVAIIVVTGILQDSSRIAEATNELRQHHQTPMQEQAMPMPSFALARGGNVLAVARTQEDIRDPGLRKPGSPSVSDSTDTGQRKDVTVECKPLQETQMMVWMVWAYDDPPDPLRIQETMGSLPKDTKVHLFCGSASCLERANQVSRSENYSCLQTERLILPSLLKGTPLESWINHHVLSKLLAGHFYEHHLQVAVQLVVAWKFGGTILQPGIKYDEALAKGLSDKGDNSNSALLASCQQNVAVASPGFGGLWSISAGKQSQAVEDVMNKFLKAYKWDKPVQSRYDPTQWPIKFDWEGSASSINKIAMDSHECSHNMNRFKDGHGGAATYYGTLNYDERHKYLVRKKNIHGMNLGDETQGLAGIQMLPRLDAFVERDRIEMVTFANSSTPRLHAGSLKDDGRRVIVFFNAWWGTTDMTWPPPAYIEPVSLSMHIQPASVIRDKFMEVSNSIVEDSRGNSLSKKKVFRKLQKGDIRSLKFIAPYLKSQEPIGARDTPTLEFFRENGIQSIFTACLTMTLSLPTIERDDSILVVDVNVKNQLKGVVPHEILQNATFLSQKLLDDEAEDNVHRFILAFERLLVYSRARLVFTSRLHVALPCVALGTPVVFVHGKSLPGGGGNRMDGLDVYMHQLNKKDTPFPENFDWANPPANPRGEDFKKQVKRIQQLTICHSGIRDSSLKFGAIAVGWSVGPEEEVCTHETTWSSNPDAIHIATCIDSSYFEHIFPSWINALSKSNPDEPLVLYILTVNLSEKNRCLLRLIVSKLLPNAKVFTIAVSVEEFEKSYTRNQRHRHISVATQARLRLPSILPCIKKLLWIDLDAFVISSIRKMWDVPVGVCGITARSSVGNYMSLMSKDKSSLKFWHDQYGKSFNAGVMVIDLERLREIKFEETIVSYWAATLGANDQETFNIACNSTHGELDPSLNVFQRRAKKDTPDRRDWVIAHFQGATKPWSGNWNTRHWSSGYFWKIWEDHATSFENVLDI